MTEQATLAGGCFWCLEAVYDQLQGVEKVVSGYTGGHVANPTYRQVCSETTGHAEAVQITYDPAVISYQDLLNVFFTIHDPTTLNRQGNDIGESYRSAIFYANDEQKKIAEDTIQRLTEEKLWNDPIVTTIDPLKEYWNAEDYHQKYFENNPNQGYCQFVVAPKVAKARKVFYYRLKK